MLRYCARAHDTWEVSVSIGYEDSKCDGYVWTCRLSQLVELSVVLLSDSVFVIRFAWSVNKSFVIKNVLVTVDYNFLGNKSKLVFSSKRYGYLDEVRICLR